MTAIEVRCPTCAAAFQVEETPAGRPVRCPQCQEAVVLPAASPENPPPQQRASWLRRLFSGRGQRPAAASAPREWQVGQTILDDYRVEGRLGAGGMGVVHLVRSRTTREPFAVKRTRVRDAQLRRSFLAELQTWIDLPPHPHLTACRFFRTVEDELVIFAEYVEGGSLADWIHDRKLTQLEQILDVAIQFAWGLDALHRLGHVHQDVKPGNVLMTRHGVAKVADFGMARARARAETAEPVPEQSTLVSVRGKTRAYCSPEQYGDRPCSRRTDVWSWGVSVLEMFVGEVTWYAGPVAGHVLEAYLKKGGRAGELPAMPPALAEVLRRCFRQEPAERWPSLAEVAEALTVLYRRSEGQDYPRPRPATPRPGSTVAPVHDRRTVEGVQWTDPRDWLREGLQAEGRDAAEVEALLAPRVGSRKSQTIADLSASEEALHLFERLVSAGRSDLENRLADLCIDKAFVHISADDVPGAVALYDRAIAIRERLVEQEGRRELAPEIPFKTAAAFRQALEDAV